ncbi:MAG: mechanosensitive ion channel, partial [Verrucomicrobia bacterium]|nr:mechanosensitive ion channel [Verrucomicrobiota bacterium]
DLAFLIINTALLMMLVGSPVEPVYHSQNPARIFWLQILICCWWALAARELITFLELLTSLRKGAFENQLLFDVLAGGIYVCSVLIMMGAVFRLPLQGLLATSGIIAIVLGLALQSTLSDLFSGISLVIEKPYEIGDEILLEGGVEGEVIQMNWRSTHLKNGANDVVVIPNSAIAKMRIQNHSAGSKQYSGTVNLIIDARNEPDFAIEILKQAAMTCPAILEHPPCTIAPTDLKGDQITYEIGFSTSVFSSAGNARSQLISQIYKRSRPIADHNGDQALVKRDTAVPLFFFAEHEFLDHIPLFEPLTSEERSKLSAKIVRRHFESGEQLLVQGEKAQSIHFIYSGVLEGSRQVKDGRKLFVRRLGPGDTYGEISLLTGAEASVTLTAITSGLVLGGKAEDLKPILEARPELCDALSHAVANLQKVVARFDESAVREVAIEPHDLFWRIRNFFRLNVEAT